MSEAAFDADMAKLRRANASPVDSLILHGYGANRLKEQVEAIDRLLFERSGS